MRVFHHLYVSHAAREFTADELAEIATEAAESFKQVGITGMLLYGCGVFIELIEGDPHYVEFVMETIRTDPRHNTLTTITVGKTPKRVFQDWTMHVLNTGIIGRTEILTDASCLQQYLNFLPETDASKRTVAGLKYFRERATELPADPAAHLTANMAANPALGEQAVAAPAAAQPEAPAEPNESDESAPQNDTSTPADDGEAPTETPATPESDSPTPDSPATEAPATDSPAAGDPPAKAA